MIPKNAFERHRSKMLRIPLGILSTLNGAVQRVLNGAVRNDFGRMPGIAFPKPRPQRISHGAVQIVTDSLANP